jgi:hypothetical protein
MDTERLQRKTSPDRVEAKAPSLPANQERIIDICHELLCAGLPIADVLKEAKRLSHDVDNTARLGASAPIESSGPVSHSSAALLEQASAPHANPGSSAPFSQHGFVRQWVALRGRHLLALAVVLLSLATIVASVQLGAARQKAELQSDDQLRRQLRERGRLISDSLRPELDKAALKDIRQLDAALRRFASGTQGIRLLFAPGGSESFYHVASWPSDSEDLEAQRRQLVRLGILDRLPASCGDGEAFELLVSSTSAGDDGVAVNPLRSPAGCWVILSSFPIDSRPRLRTEPAALREAAVQTVNVLRGAH